MIYRTSEAGARGFRHWLIAHDYKDVMQPIEVNLNNKEFHYIIKTKDKDFYCLFKHEFFYTFNNTFKLFFEKYPNLNGAGESINVDKLNYAHDRFMTLIFIYENGYFYEIEPKEIFKVHLLAKEFYPNGFIREQSKLNSYIQEGSKVEFNERTISFPIKLLKRLI